MENDKFIIVDENEEISSDKSKIKDKSNALSLSIFKSPKTLFILSSKLF